MAGNAPNDPLVALEAIDAQLQRGGQQPVQRNRVRNQNPVEARFALRIARLRREHQKEIQSWTRRLKKCSQDLATRNMDLAVQQGGQRLRTGVRGKGQYKRWTAGAMLRVSSGAQLFWGK